MKHLKDCPIPTSLHGYQTPAGRWVLQLPDPFRRMHWFPVDAVTLSELLDISPRTAVRICQRQTRLRPCEITYLQVMVFGLVPDPMFYQFRMFIRAGRLYCADYPGIELAPGELAAWQTERRHYADVRHELDDARRRIAELERLLHPEPPRPSNVIRFPGHR